MNQIRIFLYCCAHQSDQLFIACPSIFHPLQFHPLQDMSRQENIDIKTCVSTPSALFIWTSRVCPHFTFLNTSFCCSPIQQHVVTCSLFFRVLRLWGTCVAQYAEPFVHVLIGVRSVVQSSPLPVCMSKRPLARYWSSNCSLWLFHPCVNVCVIVECYLISRLAS